MFPRSLHHQPPLPMNHWSIFPPQKNGQNVSHPPVPALKIHRYLWIVSVKQFHFKHLETKRFLNSSVDGAKTAAHASLHHHECCPSCCACQIDWLETKITRLFWGPTLSMSVEHWYIQSEVVVPAEIHLNRGRYHTICMVFFLHSFSASNVLQIFPERSPSNRQDYSYIGHPSPSFNSAFLRLTPHSHEVWPST